MDAKAISKYPTGMNSRQFETIIIGLGKTGYSCAQFLAKQGTSFAMVDSSTQPLYLERFRHICPDVPLYLGRFDAGILGTAGQIIISPGVSPDDPAIQSAIADGTDMIGDIELFARNARAPVVAVTGSNGKSTVSTLISMMIAEAGLKVMLGGNIGMPALSLLEQVVPDYYVLELSSFQLETVKSLNAIAAVVLNISADHMDRYPDITRYAAMKEKIYQGTGYMIINYDDVLVTKMQRDRRDIIGYTFEIPDNDKFGLTVSGATEWLSHGNQLLLPVTELHIKGRHNYSNALAALCLGHAIGLQNNISIAALKKFQGLPHRLELVKSIMGIDWINDSKATNPRATCAAIEGLGANDNLILIAGGKGKGADFSPLKESVKGRVREIILIGRDTQKIAAALEKENNICFATSMESAVYAAAGLACPGDKVLLSPACASFDMFSNYQERGSVFIESVNKLEEKDFVHD